MEFFSFQFTLLNIINFKKKKVKHRNKAKAK